MQFIYSIHFGGKTSLKRSSSIGGERKNKGASVERDTGVRARHAHTHNFFFEVNIQENQNLGKYLTASIRFAWRILGTDVPPTECAHIRKLMFEQNF